MTESPSKSRRAGRFVIPPYATACLCLVALLSGLKIVSETAWLSRRQHYLSYAEANEEYLAIPMMHKTIGNYSTFQCDVGGADNERECVMENFCLSLDGGVFPRYQLQQLPFSNSSKAQLSTYTNQGEPVYWRPRFDYDPTRLLSGKVLTEKPLLLVYAPAAWPNKFPVHTLMNHILPLFRALTNADPLRAVPFGGRGKMFNYRADILAVAGGFRVDKPIPIPNEANHTRELLDMLGVGAVMNGKAAKSTDGFTSVLFSPREDATNTSTYSVARHFDTIQSNQVWCYDKIHAGVGGSRAHWSYRTPLPNELDDPLLWHAFRRTLLLSGNGCPGPWQPTQSSLDRPHVVIIQRTEGGLDRYGRRVLDNIDDIVAMLNQLAADKLISFSGKYVQFSHSNSAREQLCQIAPASILIGVHGNSLGLGVVMERGTVMIELSPIVSDFYAKMTRAIGLKHITVESEVNHTPDVNNIKQAVKKAIKQWKMAFAVVD